MKNLFRSSNDGGGAGVAASEDRPSYDKSVNAWRGVHAMWGERFLAMARPEGPVVTVEDPAVLATLAMTESLELVLLESSPDWNALDFVVAMKPIVELEVILLARNEKEERAAIEAGVAVLTVRNLQDMDIAEVPPPPPPPIVFIEQSTEAFLCSNRFQIIVVPDVLVKAEVRGFHKKFGCWEIVRKVRDWTPPMIHGFVGRWLLEPYVEFATLSVLDPEQLYEQLFSRPYPVDPPTRCLPPRDEVIYIPPAPDAEMPAKHAESRRAQQLPSGPRRP